MDKYFNEKGLQGITESLKKEGWSDEDIESTIGLTEEYWVIVQKIKDSKVMTPTAKEAMMVNLVYLGLETSFMQGHEFFFHLVSEVLPKMITKLDPNIRLKSRTHTEEENLH